MKEKNVFVTPVMEIPQYEALSDKCHSFIFDITETIKMKKFACTRDLCENIIKKHPENLNKMRNSLYHKYSSYYESRINYTDCPSAKSHHEQEALDLITNRTPGSLIFSDSIYFTKFLCDTAQFLTGRKGEVRERSVTTVADAKGMTRHYPAPSLIPSKMAEISLFLRENIRRSPVFTAVVSMNSIVNCHPFPDGNGRVSRILFNFIIRESLTPDFYLPLYEISAISKGGFLIRLRDAQYNSNWTALFEFILNSINYTHAIHQATS